MPNESLKVRIITPRKVIFEDQALSVSSTNSSGKFDILPEHANFITIVENQTITIRIRNKRRLTFSFPLAIIYNINNMVNIYTDISIK